MHCQMSLMVTLNPARRAASGIRRPAAPGRRPGPARRAGCCGFNPCHDRQSC